jgi:sec-independent protein translocase protein TatB
MDLFSSIGTQEILMILLVAIIVIGPAKIVEFGKTMGKFTRNIKQASTDLTMNLTKELEEEEKGKATTSPAKPPKKS